MKLKFNKLILISLLVFNLIPYFKVKADKEDFDLYNEEIQSSNLIDTSSEEVKKEFKSLIEDLFTKRNTAIVSGDSELLKEFYDLKIKVSLWAYESEAKKTQYLINWSEKQSVKFKDLKSIVRIRKVAEKEPGLYGIICDVATDFNYYYVDSPETINHFRLGTNHYLNLRKQDDRYIITKEWYTDPFADSLDLNNIKSDEIKNYLLTQTTPEYTPSEKIQKAIDYAHS